MRTTARNFLFVNHNWPGDVHNGHISRVHNKKFKKRSKWQNVAIVSSVTDRENNFRNKQNWSDLKEEVTKSMTACLPLVGCETPRSNCWRQKKLKYFFAELCCVSSALCSSSLQWCFTQKKKMCEMWCLAASGCVFCNETLYIETFNFYFYFLVVLQ